MSLYSWIVLALRESRGSGGRLAFFALCLAVGVAAVVSVAGLSQALDDGIRAQARELLAADIAVESRRPMAPALLAAVDDIAGARRAELVELPSVVSMPAAGASDAGSAPSVLAELKAVSPDYPFFGELELAPPRPLAELLDDQSVLVAPELLLRLGLVVGEHLKVGRAVFTIAGTVHGEPDRLEMSFTLGPRVLLSLAALERSGLVGLGSRVKYRLLVRLPDGSSAAELTRTAAALLGAAPDPEFVEVETYLEAQPTLRRGLERVGQFLGLVALLSLVIGGIGVAQAVRAWLAGRLHAIAVLRALGVRPREVFGLYLGQTVLLALAGSLFGALLGSLVARAVPLLLGGMLPVQVAVGWQPAAMLRGLALGVAVALLFALRPLVDVVRVPPLLVLRRQAASLPLGRAVAAALWTVLVIGVAVIATLQSGSLLRGVQFALGMVVATLLLTAGAWALMRGVAASPRQLPAVSLRHGLAALARPGAGTLGAVVALGLGVVTVLAMHLVQQRLAGELAAELPADAPTAFLVDIQPDQWDGVRAALEQAGALDVDSVAVVVARLASLNGAAVSELVAARDDEEGRRRRWVLTREQRLTSMAVLPAGNVIVDGALWSHPLRDELSIEREFAADLGVGVGDTLVLDVQGTPLELLVSSIRSVDWGRFSINFFLVVEPGVLAGAPHFRIATARLPASAELPLQNRLAAEFPNVTVLRLREVLDKVVAILEQVGFGVRLLGGFTVLAGIAILGGAVSAGAVRRGREVALYKTLGMTRRQVVSAFAVEYALVGLVAGAIGAVGGVALAWAVVRFGMEMSWTWSPGSYLAAVALTVALTVAAGLAVSVRALKVRPLAVLRQGE